MHVGSLFGRDIGASRPSNSFMVKPDNEDNTIEINVNININGTNGNFPASDELEDNRGGLTDEDNGDEDQNQDELEDNRGGLTDEDNGDEDQNQGHKAEARGWGFGCPGGCSGS